MKARWLLLMAVWQRCCASTARFDAGIELLQVLALDDKKARIDAGRAWWMKWMWV